MIQKQKIIMCDGCGKIIPESGLHDHANRIVGVEGKLMIHLSIDADPGNNWNCGRRRTLILCPHCWKRIFRSVRRVLKLEEKGENQ